ncbi:hypothetical protein K505DRAFT_371161 [Melanomma pulvis-pyrius CBS 109.77]|uniref:Mediator of RNA polymerase II transcription subunit 13 n=1 Tax=Melanomma pulvis-pyrius CBS 109.77 TaxID=1314802 RepID=A0A6A6XRZ3_9PLEO|nr:hypothetical protein K505DRAFT_371161 [Melanomma pulvis-pyrius CBS 109.77]
MDFLKTCDTNAQAIGEFEAVAFQAFSVKRTPTPPPATPFDWAPSEDIRAVEAELRQEQHLVVQDASRPWLWFFRATTIDQLGQTPPHLPVLEGYSLQREQFGVMKASELARPPIRNMNPTSSPSGSTNSPSTSAPIKGPQAGGGRLAQGASQSAQPNDQQPPHDSCAIYELFTSSVVALLSYFLVKDHNAVALNYRTFVSKPAAYQDPDRPETNLSDITHWLTNVNVFWASSGTLVVSMFSLVKPEIHCLGDVAAEDIEKRCLGTCVRVAPNGLLAKVVSFDDPLDNTTEDGSQRLQRKRLKIGPVGQGIERWKAMVTRWLTWKGYAIPDLEKRISWARIRIAHTDPMTASSPASSFQSREILWPRALCFFYGASANQPILSIRTTNPLDWFETPNSAGFQDPMDVAQQWFLGQPERDKILEAQQRAKKAEEEAARPKEEISSLYPSSPLNSRTGAYGDLQSVSGVYPTPPDGILPGTVLSSSDTPSLSGAIPNTLLVPGGNNPAINLLMPQDSVATDGQQHPPTSPEFSLPFDHFNSSGGNDDLFEDMDEDEFDGNGVTDADFNFFDEPDDDDIDMLDAPALPNNKPAHGRKIAKEKQAPPLPNSEMNDDASDPLAALEDALATASDLLEETMQDSRMEQHATEHLPAEPELMDVSQSQPSLLETQNTDPVSKEPTPPLSPHFIQQTLLPSPKDKLALQTPRAPTPGRHGDSIFDPISFNKKLTLSDAKYQAGRFSFVHEIPPQDDAELQEVLKRPVSLRNVPLLTKLRYAMGVASNRGIPDIASLARAYSDDSDSASETSSVPEEDSEDDVSIGPEPLSAGFILPGKRKLPTDGNATPMSATSYAESFGGEVHESVVLQTDEGSLASFEPSPWDWSLTNVPAPIELQSTSTRYNIPSFSPAVSSMPNTPTSQPDLYVDPPDEKPPSGKDIIAVAQIVTDQIVSATLDIFHEDSETAADNMYNLSYSRAKLETVVKSIFPTAIDCDVLGLVSVQDVFPGLPPQAKGQQRPPPRRINDVPASPGYQMHQLSPPYIRVRRADTRWDMLPPALAFWEPLGLSPCSPAKNIVPFCLYPYSESIKPCVENFLVNIQIAYDTCKLGTHARVETIPEYEGDIRGGLVPCKIGPSTSIRSAFKAIRDASVQLGKILAARHAQLREKDDGQKAHKKIDAFVIYMIDPFDTPSAIWELCSAFWTLFQTYGQGPPGRPETVPKPDLVLQIVPIKYIASFEVPVVLDSGIYGNLAREVYDRCPPSLPSEDKTPLSIYAAPSFQLEEAMPRAIPFKLNAEPPQDLLRENSYMHLGYAISLDGTWVTAAWTDSYGKSQAVVSYNLGTRIFYEIAKEIWQTTVEILQARRVTWRVCIARAGVMDREELETWISLASCPTQLNLFITLLTVDTTPPLSFTPTLPPDPPTNLSATYPSTNTPGSTPQPGLSPDPHSVTPAATPSADQTNDPIVDPEARFVDATDESWGIILSHRLHNSNSTIEFRPCVISGLLVKRGSTYATCSTLHPIPDPERGPIVVGVNILWVGAVGSTRVATSPFPTSAAAEGVSPGGAGPSPLGERSSTSLMWTPTAQTRATAENLLKEMLSQFRALGLLARLKGMRGTRHGTVPWHVVAAMRGVEGMRKCL